MEAVGHTVVAPIDHVANMYEATITCLRSLVETVQTVAMRYEHELGATGFNLLHASGADAQQSVDHLHVHLIPRWSNDGLNAWPALRAGHIDRAAEYERLVRAFSR
jgi:histidine triad (HIT) family protein